jgi:hypothetical protein
MENELTTLQKKIMDLESKLTYRELPGVSNCFKYEGVNLPINV